MSKTQQYLESLAERTAQAVWSEWNICNTEGYEDATLDGIRELISHEIYSDMEELFDMLWYDCMESEHGSPDKMPLTYAVCKEIAQMIPDHLEIMYDMDTDFNQIV